ncbi:2Fe-2S iron-sulfur cluster-binding protein [Dermatobacter hominis]|uniref:2Fe-2S iron-sulfur cluster-binding protein n=1 Tax=Dermatobacter hominis TaxID=2884263 RepID=UPI001D10B841|nr:2Fe-2S iron-sulfur cluster-binding protein [Dermatobacter hominis]UDY34404.1 2Fe-2S iron-sulfur cluster-binding protein [Dermatobacter hominis]
MPSPEPNPPTEPAAGPGAVPPAGPAPSAAVPAREVRFTLDGTEVAVDDDGITLLDALRGRLGITSAKDGCSPQGQCGCCTVVVDGTARVACVTPLRRVAGREVVTFDGLDADVRGRWAEAFLGHGASQCGFCSPGIIVRLEALRAKVAAEGGDLRPGAVDRALAAHLCRCTGWQSIEEAAADVLGVAPADTPVALPGASDRDLEAAASRDLEAAARRATLELGAPQRVGPDVAAGAVGFSADTAPTGALVAVPGPDGGWAVAAGVTEARRAAGKVQGRRTTIEPAPPLDVPDGGWDLTLRTSWVDAAYVETDASWCEPGGEPSPAAANGGAFGGKRRSPLPEAARALADEHGRAVLALWSREDCTRSAPKRPPLAAGIRADGTGTVHVVRTEGIAARIAAVAPGLDVVEVDAAGPPTSTALRAAGWAEAVVLLAGVGAPSEVVAVQPGALGADDDRGERVVVRTPDGAVAEASVTIADGPSPVTRIAVRIAAGEVLDAVVLRSYCIGAAHMALSWVTSEGLAVDDDGTVLDLTVRSLGVLRAADMPPVDVEVRAGDGPPVRGSDAVFAAVAAATWRALGTPPVWPARPA